MKWLVTIGVLAALAIVGLGVVVIGRWAPVIAMALGNDRTGRQFYISSEAMRPTLVVGDRVFPGHVTADLLTRGRVIVFDQGKTSYVKRIAALGGDRIALRDGIVVLNGRPVRQTLSGSVPGNERTRDQRVSRLIEQFPGEAMPHALLDSGASQGDTYPEVVVPAGHVFVLGDNRDNSADSRFSILFDGVEMLPVDRVTGTIDSIAWSTGRKRFARSIDDLGADDDKQEVKQ